MNNLTASIVLTKTMLDKSIIDANHSVRLWALEEFNVDYDEMSKTRDKRRAEVMAYVNNTKAKVRFYLTARGDRRISIQGIKDIAGVGDEIILSKSRTEV